MAPHIGILSVAVHFPAAQSLKDKRMIIRSLKDRVRAKFNVSISELDGQDKWQVATLGFVMIGTDNRYVDSRLQHVLSFVDSYHGLEVCNHEFELV